MGDFQNIVDSQNIEENPFFLKNMDSKLAGIVHYSRNDPPSF